MNRFDSRITLVATVFTATVAATGLALSAPAMGTVSPAPRSSDTVEVYVSTSGDDDAGGTPDDPVASLAGVNELLLGVDAEQAIVRIEPGVYHESTTIDWSELTVPTLVFEPTDDSADERPTFDGSEVEPDDGVHVWMRTEGGPSLEMRGMLVRHYGRALRIVGTDGNVVSDMVFEELGNQHVDGVEGYAAVHLADSSNNTFETSRYQHLENTDCPGCIHAIYATTGSSDNRIEGNVFEYITGDPVRLVDDTHRNTIRENTFRTSTNGSDPGRAMASFWRFDNDEECGSENRIDENTYDGRYYNGEAGAQIMGSGADSGVDRCADAVAGSGNQLESPVRSTVLVPTVRDRA